MSNSAADSSMSVVSTGSHSELAFNYVDRPAQPYVPYQAPELPPHFVPRNELLMVKQLLIRNPGALAPITLHGPSGSGKTTLVAALAHDADVLKTFPDGVLWASLGEDGDIQQAQAVWGAALGNDLSHVPDAASRTAALRALLSDLRCLLIIDDVTDVEQVRTLNVGGQYCARLITTNNADHVAALKSRRILINKLSEAEALALLTDWAGMLPEIYQPTVKEIIRRLGNWPLSLALVGAQARQGITWLRLLEVLRDDQGPIATLEPDKPQVRANALGLIVNLVLSRFGGVQLRRSALLGAFAAGTSAPFSDEAVAACWQMSVEEARATLDLLVDSALLQRVSAGLYSLHSELRHHLRRAATPHDLFEASERIQQYYLALVESGSLAIGPQLGQIMAVFRQIHRQDPATAQLFADALSTYFERHGLWANLVRLLNAMIESTDETGDLARQQGYLDDLGYAHTVLGSLSEARACFERSLSISRQLGDLVGEAAALNNIGAVYERESAYPTAEDYYRQSLVIRETLGMRDDIAEALNNLAGVLYWQRRWDEALNTFQRVLDMYVVMNDRQGQAQAWLNIGAVYEGLGNDQQALESYQRSLAIYTNLGDRAGEAQALNNLGIVILNQGDPERALSYFRRSLAIREQLGDRSGQALTLNNIALLYESTGALHLALENYERSHEILVLLEDPRAQIVLKNIDTLNEKIGRNR